jgi:glutamate synthase (NADPH/NADH) small chain
MGKITGFLEIERQDRASEKPETRVHNYHEFVQPLPYVDVSKQAARCMDCGIPFCHGPGCPVNNQIPDWNDLVYNGEWEEAASAICTRPTTSPNSPAASAPRPARQACTLNIEDSPVTIKTIECAIVDKAWEEGWVTPQVRARKRPARRWPWSAPAPPAWPARSSWRAPVTSVTVFERESRVGGLLRYGIPDFKMEKHLIDRRVAPDGRRRRHLPHQCRGGRGGVDGHAAGRL